MDDANARLIRAFPNIKVLTWIPFRQKRRKGKVNRGQRHNDVILLGFKMMIWKCICRLQSRRREYSTKGSVRVGFAAGLICEVRINEDFPSIAYVGRKMEAVHRYCSTSGPHSIKL